VEERDTSPGTMAVLDPVDSPIQTKATLISRVKSLGAMALGLLFFGALILVAILILKGLVWASENLLPWVMLAAMVAIVLDIVVLLPLSLFRTLRAFTGGALFLSSYLIGLATWMVGFILTGALWGGFALGLGLFLFGVGVVPMALLATLFKGMWGNFFGLLIMIAMTLIVRIVGFAIAKSSER
jgi:hypothetical protein